MADKPLVWLGSSLEDLREFPNDARQEGGFQLRRVQKGLSPVDWKPMSAVGPGVIEIRIRVTQEYRVFYVAKFAEAIYVLHAFKKQTQKTPSPMFR
jgi:phage-related protein